MVWKWGERSEGGLEGVLRSDGAGQLSAQRLALCGEGGLVERGQAGQMPAHASQALHWGEAKPSIVYPTETLRVVIQRFLLTKSPNVYLDKHGRVLGVIDMNDVINYLL